MLRGMSASLIGTLLLAISLTGMVVVIHNRLVKARNRMREGWSGVDVQLKRRHDLIPALLTTVQAYARHEKALLERLADARREALLPQEPKTCSSVESRLGAELTQLRAVVEQWPELKADAHYRRLMDELVEVEDAIQFARRYYNGAVRELNNALESFPSNWVGRFLGFRQGDFFEIAEVSERHPPQIRP